MNLMTMTRTLQISCASAVCALVIGCETSNNLLKTLGAKAPEEDQSGLGLTRESFGALDPTPLKPHSSSCNETPPDAVNAVTDKVFAGVINPMRNDPNGPATDADAQKEGLLRFFTIPNTRTKTLIRVIDRTDESVDFWFKDDAVLESNKAEDAAKKYCKDHGNREAQYVGFKSKCGDQILLPFKVQSKQKNVDVRGGRVTVKDAGKPAQPVDLKIFHEERIVAFNCR